MTKQCRKCHQILSIDNFLKCKRAKDGRQGLCRKCMKDYNKVLNAENRDRFKKRDKEYYKEHSEERRNYTKEYREGHREEIRKYNKEHREEGSRYGRKCYANHQEERRKCAKEYYKKHQEEKREYAKEYWKEYYPKNRDKILERVKAYQTKNREDRIKYNKELYVKNRNERLVYMKKYQSGHREERLKYGRDYNKDHYDYVKKGYPKGENHCCWKGGISPLEKMIRGLPEYRKWRISIFKKYHYTCVQCIKRGRVSLEAHHNKKPFAEMFHEFLEKYDQFSPIEDKETLVRLAIKYKPFWNLNNGEPMCKKCHDEIHKLRSKLARV